jgi:hypothetical protein
MTCNEDLRRITVIQQKTSTFETSANNLGMRASRGRYLIIVQVWLHGAPHTTHTVYDQAWLTCGFHLIRTTWK